MNHVPARAPQLDHVMRRKAETYGFLDEVLGVLELSPAQSEAAKTSYEAVAEWLSDADDPVLQSIRIYVQGSTALGTTVRPLGKDEHDVDLICFTPDYAAARQPAGLMQIVGARLRKHTQYARMLEEKKRCWRLNYAREFHLDISPTIKNTVCTNGGELVPDKRLRTWKPTNPKGYKRLFDQRAALLPRLRVETVQFAEDTRAETEPFPETARRKGVLRRTVQLLKRHRDVMFQDEDTDIAPISVIVTTLAARAYAYCVGQFNFDTEFDVVVATIRLMPHFIERPVIAGKKIYLVANETTEGENFAERWNSEPERASAFFRWHEKVLADMEELAAIEGLDQLAAALEKLLGTRPVREVLDSRTGTISKAREAERLFVAPSVGLTLKSSPVTTQVRRNTNFGD